MSNLVTIKEFCQIYSVSESSVYRLLRLGLPSVKLIGLGRRIILDKASNWLQSQPRGVKVKA